MRSEKCHHYARKNLARRWAGRPYDLVCGFIVRLFDIVNRLITKVLVTWPHGYVASSVMLSERCCSIGSSERKFGKSAPEQSRLRDLCIFTKALYG